jgi:hypothetical protein
MRKMLVIYNENEYEFDIDEGEYSILNEEYPYDCDDDEFDDNELAEFITEIDNLVIELIEYTEPFDNMDLDDIHIEYFVSRDNYDIVVNIIDLN